VPVRGVRNVAKVRPGTRINFERVPVYPLNIQKRKSTIDAMTLLTNVCICLNLDGITWLKWHLIDIMLFCPMRFNMCTMVRLRPSAIRFTQQQQPPVSGRICWAIAVAPCCHSTADCKAPKKLFNTPWPWPLPLPTSPTRATPCLPVKWLGSIADSN